LLKVFDILILGLRQHSSTENLKRLLAGTGQGQ